MSSVSEDCAAKERAAAGAGAGAGAGVAAAAAAGTASACLKTDCCSCCVPYLQVQLTKDVCDTGTLGTICWLLPDNFAADGKETSHEQDDAGTSMA